MTIYDFDIVTDRHGTLCTKWDNLEARMGNKNAWALWVADTDFRCSKPIQDAILKRAEHPIFGYSFVPPEFFECVRGWLLKRHQWDVPMQDIRFFPGIVPFLGVGIRALTNVGDEVAILTPVYHPFKMMIEENRRVATKCSLLFDGDTYSIDWVGLEEILKRDSVTMLIFCNPHNPVGKVYSKEDLERVAELCQKHGVVVLSDEIHSDVVFSGNKHVPIASINKASSMNTVTCMSPSKAFNIAGLKASAIMIHNPKIKELIDKEIAATHVSTPNVFAMAAFMAAYNESEDYLDQEVSYIERNVEFLDSWLVENTPKIRLIKPQGTYLLWLDCSLLGMGGDELHDFFTNEAEVAVNKGEIFGSEGFDFVRINVACPRSVLEVGLKRILDAYRKRGF